MELIRGLHNLQPRHCGCVGTIGAFDGVHLGHQELMTRLVAKGKELALPTVVICFEPLPREYFAAMFIRSKNEQTQFETKVKDYQSKAMLILQKTQKGGLSTEDGDRLAKEALVKKEENQEHVNRTIADVESFSKSVSQLEGNVNSLRTNISKWENELKTLKARVKVANATKNLNKQMAAIDSSSTVNMLEKMKEKITQEEALANAYGDIANESKSIDDEINKVLDSKNTSADNDLDALKKQMGL